MSSVAIRWRVVPFGDAALLVEGEPVDLLTNHAVVVLAQALDAESPAGVYPSVPAINSLLVPFDPLRVGFAALERVIHELLEAVAPTWEDPARVVTIPVRYGGDDGPDLLHVAERTGMTPQEVVAVHCAPVYRVLLIGFAPGFPYLGPLPEPLRQPRRATPRTSVPMGSVAIAADMSGIYPANLPGGWHVLGRTPLHLFDPAASPPALLEPGAAVRFVALPDGIVP